MQRLVASYAMHLDAADHLQPRTRELYAQHARRLADHLATRDITELTREDLEQYIHDLAQETSASNAGIHYRSLQQFFRWAIEEEEIEDSPMRHVRPPKAKEVVIPVVERDGLLRLLAATAGKDFDSRRDHAMFCVLMDAGPRRGELAGMTTRDVDLIQRTVRVVGKGNRERVVPVGVKAVKALDRYERARSKHPHHALDAYWVGRWGALTGTGIFQMIRRRCKEAGIPALHPHQFRHTFASSWLEAGGQETDLMRIAGWRSRAMVARYGSAAADARARKAHASLSPLDNL